MLVQVIPISDLSLASIRLIVNTPAQKRPVYAGNEVFIWLFRLKLPGLKFAVLAGPGDNFTVLSLALSVTRV
jgi:hypothetical protein